MAVVPYVKGLSEKISRIFRKRNISTAMKPHCTLRRMLVSPKDKTEPREGVYTINCQNCDGVYIGETKRSLSTRVKEHKDEVEKLTAQRPFTRANRKESETK